VRGRAQAGGAEGTAAAQEAGSERNEVLTGGNGRRRLIG
jgi:hypothetical protein